MQAGGAAVGQAGRVSIESGDNGINSEAERSGAVDISSGSGYLSGRIRIESGSAAGESGHLQLLTGTSEAGVATGSIEMSTGDSPLGEGGGVTVSTGLSGGDEGADVRLFAGDSLGSGGDMVFAAGEAILGGSISFDAGVGSSSGGSVRLASGQGVSTSGEVVLISSDGVFTGGIQVQT